MNSNTKVCIVEINPHRQTSSVWIGATTVGEVISLVARETAFKATQPTEFLQKNNNFDYADFLDADGEIDFEKATDWENSLPIEAHFEAATDCAENDGHEIRVYWTREEAEEAGAPRYMSEEEYGQKLNLIF